MDLTKFEESMKHWLLLDTQIRVANMKLREMRNQHAGLTKTVCDFIRENKMENRKIETHDSKIEYYEKRMHPSLSYAFLEKHLEDIIHDTKKVEYIISYLKSKRETKTAWDIKRVFKKGMKRGTAKVQESGAYESESD